MQRRCAVAVASRLQSLGALTRGDRRAATGFDLEAYSIDTKYGRKALQTVLDTIQWRMVFRGEGVEQRLLSSAAEILKYASAAPTRHLPCLVP